MSKGKMLSILLCLLILSGLTCQIVCQCHADCNRHGYCNKAGQCECFSNWHGPDCSLRTCPTGPAVRDPDHANIECSGNGQCDRTTGICACAKGYTGAACGVGGCVNDCSGRGRCLGMREMGVEHDGYKLNYSATYNAWDGDIFKTCLCDYGFSGPDCSQRDCPYGPDPRLSTSTTEMVTLVCDCSAGCQGKFRLAVYGRPLKGWLTGESNTSSLQALLTSAEGVPHSFASGIEISVHNDQANTTLCTSGLVTHNQLTFRREANMPKMAVYIDRMAPGSLYFQTKQTLLCDCTAYNACNGTFRLSFDGQMSSGLDAAANGTAILSALSGMEMLARAGYTVSASEYRDNNRNDYFPAPLLTALCSPYAINNMTIVMRGKTGNAPLLGVWSSVVGNLNPLEYDSSNTTTTRGGIESIVSVQGYDGRDDVVEICNGLGKCDYSTGTCQCATHYGPDPAYGPCGKLQYNTSRDPGLGRCPGQYPLNFLSSANPSKYDSVPNHAPSVYLSLNPLPPGTGADVSAIFELEYKPYELRGISIPRDSKVWLLDLTSSTSAGALALDNRDTALYFVDANPADRFIGRTNLTSGSVSNYTRYITLDVSQEVFALVLDVTSFGRRVYYSVPYDGTIGDKGAIYWATMDTVRNPTVYSLVDNIDQNFLFHPFGMAVHLINRRVYWIDNNHTLVDNNSSAVLRSVDSATHSQLTQIVVFPSHANNPLFPNRSEVVNITDIMIDFADNNTVYLLDATLPYFGVYAISLDSPITFDPKVSGTPNCDYALTVWQANVSDILLQYQGYVSPRRIFSAWEQATGQPRYMMADPTNDLIFWTDSYLNDIAYARVGHKDNDFFPIGYAFQGNYSAVNISFQPVGLAMSDGMGPISFGSGYVDCYGRGVCDKNTLKCHCHQGFFGDCQLRHCPMALAWVSEPRVNNTAHDVLLPCAGVGLCNYATGTCSCPTGYAGQACERMTCQSVTGCGGNGRCVPFATVNASSSSWEADRIHTCLIDTYGTMHRALNNIHIAAADNDTVTGTVPLNAMTIATVTGNLLNEFACPYGFNIRNRDVLLARLNFNKALSITSSSAVTAAAAEALLSLREIQQIICAATYGSFVLSFDGVQFTIPANMSIADFQYLLESSLPAVGYLAVASNSPTMCTTAYGGAVTNITFMSLYTAEVPLLTIESESVYGRPGTVQATRLSAVAFDLSEECAGNGRCDRSSGLCKCWDHYGSSDGLGNPGIHGDCGARLE